jgi:hypothetical protein
VKRHLAEHHHDRPLPLRRQLLPHRRGRTIAHGGIQANASRRITLGTQFSVTRRDPSIFYQRHPQWHIELFKWVKQHLRIKAFFGTTPNAVKTQI